MTQGATRPNRIVNLTNRRSGRLVVVSFSHVVPSKGAFWNCVCDCGAHVVKWGHDIRRGHVRSCGCLKLEIITAGAHLRHGHTRGRKMTTEFGIWMGMRARCQNPRNSEFHNYGGRGITVCERWDRDFAAFLADMGPKPPGRSIDRINNDGHYEPSNCRWATWKEQANNRRPQRSKRAA